MPDHQTSIEQKVVFMFPGQGSQSLEMLADFANESVLIETFKQASEVLGYDLWQLCQQGPVENLNQTDKTQPALLTASVALWRIWQTRSELPQQLAGHSLGEYSALVCAGIMDFSAAVALVEKRGQFMQQAVPSGVGKMAAIIGLDDEKVKIACAQVAQNEIVSPVNYNSPGQVVIAGNSDAVDRAMLACKESGAKKAMPLAVSVPSHCLLMKPAADKLAVELGAISLKQSTIKVVNNVDVAVVSNEAEIKDALVRQLYCPVRWSESVNFLAQQGFTEFVECGPGKILSGLNRRINKSLTSYQLQNNSSLNQAVESLS